MVFRARKVRRDSRGHRFAPIRAVFAVHGLRVGGDCKRARRELRQSRHAAASGLRRGVAEDSHGGVVLLQGGLVHARRAARLGRRADFHFGDERVCGNPQIHRLFAWGQSAAGSVFGGFGRSAADALPRQRLPVFRKIRPRHLKRNRKRDEPVARIRRRGACP